MASISALVRAAASTTTASESPTSLAISRMVSVFRAVENTRTVSARGLWSSQRPAYQASPRSASKPSSAPAATCISILC